MNFITSVTFYATVQNNHPNKTTIRLRRPMLSPPKQIFIQPLLYKKTTCLTSPAATFLVSKWKTNLYKTSTTRLYTA